MRIHARNPRFTLAVGIAAVFAAATTLAACGDDNSQSSEGSGPVVVTESGPVSLAVGQEMVVEVDANPTTGFEWSVETNSDESVVSFVNEEYMGPEDGAVGEGGEQKLTFEALADGTSDVVLVYRQPFEPDTEPAETVTLDVTVSD